MGKSGEAAEGLCIQHEVPKDTTKRQQRALLCSPPLSGSARRRCHPQPLCCGHGVGRTSPCGVSPCSQLWGSVSAQTDGPGIGYGVGAGTHTMPMKRGSKKRRKSNADPTAHLLTLFKTCLRSAWYESWSFPLKFLRLHHRAPHQTSCSLLLQPCLVRRVLQLVTMCRVKKKIFKKKKKKKKRYFTGMGRLWRSSGKSAWGLGRDFYSHFDECSPNLGLPYKTGGKWTTLGLKG